MPFYPSAKKRSRQAALAPMIGRMLDLLSVAIILCASACAASETSVAPGSVFDELDLASFTQLPDMSEIASGAVPLDLQPAAAHDHWQLRQFTNGAVVILAEGGSLDASALPSNVAAALEQRPDTAGFGTHCLPAWCFKYLVTADNAEVATLLSVDQLRSFLGDIDTPDEAALLAEASGYHWGATKEQAAIREVADGYQLLLERVVQVSAPCPSWDRYRVLLYVSRSAVLAEENSEFVDRSECMIY